VGDVPGDLARPTDLRRRQSARRRQRDAGRSQIEARLARVTERIEAAARRAGRRTSDVEILPVTKGHPARSIEIVKALGVGRIGENRVPEAEAKRSELGPTPGVAWHLIGRLQRNKARRAVRLFDVVESVDSVRLAGTLSRIIGEERHEPVEVLVQVNTSGEAAKAGLGPDVALDAVAEISELPGLRVAGLMTMAPFTADDTVVRLAFRGAARLLERCRAEVPDFEGRALSMGMSNDFAIAIEEGSTRVRLGTVLLGER